MATKTPLRQSSACEPPCIAGQKGRHDGRGGTVRQKHVDPFVTALEPARNKAACSAARPSLCVRRLGCFCVLPDSAHYHAWPRQLSCPRPLPPFRCLWQGAIYMRPSRSRGEKGGFRKEGENPRAGCVPPTLAFASFCFLLPRQGRSHLQQLAAVFPPSKCLKRPARLSSGGDAFRSQGHTGRNERGDCGLGRGGRSGAGGPWSALPLTLSAACAVHDGTQTAGTSLRSRFFAVCGSCS